MEAFIVSFSSRRISAFLFLLFCCTPTRAQTTSNWTNSAGGIFSTATNWDTNPTAPNGATVTANISLAGTYTVTLNSNVTLDNLTLNNATLNFTQSSGTLTIVNDLTLTAGVYNLQGGIISGGTISQSGGVLRPNFNSSNQLSGVTINAGVLDLSSQQAYVQLTNGSNFGSATTVNVGSATLQGGLGIAESGTISNVTINLGSQNSALTLEGSQTVTLDSTTTVSLGVATNIPSSVGRAGFVSGTSNLTTDGLIQVTAAGATLAINPTGTLMNGGTISASVASGNAANLNIVPGGSFTNQLGGNISVTGASATLTIGGSATSWQNLGTITVNGGTLILNGQFTTAGLGTINRTGGTIEVTGAWNNASASYAFSSTTGSYILTGNTITGGTLSGAGGNSLQATLNQLNQLSGVTINAGGLDLSTQQAYVELTNGSKFGSGTTINVGSASFIGGLGIGESGTISNLTVNLGSQNSALTLEGSQNVTLDSTTTVTLGIATSIASSVGRVGFFSGTSNLITDGLIQVTASGAILDVNPTGTLMNGGTISVSVATGNAANLNIVPAGSFTNLLGGTVSVTGASATLTIGGSTTSWQNLGTITVNGGTLILNGQFTTAGLGTINRTGGTIEVSGAWNNASASFAFSSTTGSYILTGGTITGGTLSGAGGNSLQATLNQVNTLSGVTINAGGLDLSTQQAYVQLTNGSKFGSGTTVNVGSASFLGGLGIGQSGTISNLTVNLGSQNSALTLEGSQNVTLDSTTTVTLGIATSIASSVGRVGFFPGTSNLTTDGLIQVTASGATLAINPTGTLMNGGAISANVASGNAANLNIVPGGSFTNQLGGAVSVTGASATLTIGGSTTSWQNLGTITVNGGTLVLNGQFTTAGLGTINRTGGTINVSGAWNNASASYAFSSTTGSYVLAGGTITGGTLSGTGGNSLQATLNQANQLNGVTINAGGLDLSTQQAFVELTNGSKFGSGTTVNVGSASFIGGLGIGESGTISNLTVNLGSQNSALTLEGSQNVTLDSTTTVNLSIATSVPSSVGRVGFTAGTSNLTTNGLIQVTASGATLNINPTGTLSNGGSLVANGSGATLVIQPTGSFTNSGTIAAQNDGVVSIPAAVAFTNFSTGTLTGGTYQVFASSTLNFNSRNVTTIGVGTTVLLNGATTTFAALNSLTTNNGSLSILGGNSYTPGTTTLGNTGTLAVGSSSAFHAAVNVSSGGAISGAGTITGAVALAGTLAPGDAVPGTMTINNSVTFTNSTSQFNVRINQQSLAAGSFDQLLVTSGTVTLNNATLNLNFNNFTGGNTGIALPIIQTTGSASLAAGSTFNGFPNGSTAAVVNGVNWTISYQSGLDGAVYLTAAPEPHHLLLICAGALGLGLFMRRRWRLRSGQEMTAATANSLFS